jgi:hypothetical protein
MQHYAIRHGYDLLEPEIYKYKGGYFGERQERITNLDNYRSGYFPESNKRIEPEDYPGKIFGRWPIDLNEPFGFAKPHQSPNQGKSFLNYNLNDIKRETEEMSKKNNGKAGVKKNGNGKKPQPKNNKQMVPRPITRPGAIMQYSSAAAAYGGSYQQFGDSQQVTRIRKCEYIGDIRSSGEAFALNTFNLNPGDSLSFPWLSTIAPAWEYYKVDSMRLIYKPNCASTTVGTLAIAVDYDMGDSAPANKQDLAEFRPYVSGVPWSTEIVYQVPRYFLNLHNNGKLLVRSPADAITNLTDLGILYVMTQDVLSGFLGELYIDYDLILINQQQSDLCASLSAHIVGVSNSDTNPFSTSFAQIAPDRPWVSQAGLTGVLEMYVAGEWLMVLHTISATGLTAINVTGSNGATQVAEATLLNAAGTESIRVFTINVASTSLKSPALLTVALAGNTGAATTHIRFAPYEYSLS